MTSQTLLVGLAMIGALGCGSSERPTAASAPAAPARPNVAAEPAPEVRMAKPARFESMLDEPHLFGITLGDTSGYVTRVLGVKTGNEQRCSNESALERDAADSWFCWDRTRLQGDLAVRAGFAEAGDGLHLYALEVDYPFAEGRRVLADLEAEPELGPIHAEVAPGTLEWDWGHARVTLKEVKDRVTLSIRSLLPVSAPGSLSKPRTITPWNVLLGHDSKSTAEAKLTAAGFSLRTSCVELTSPGAAARVESCGYENPSVVGLQSLKLELTSFRGAEAKASALECLYDPALSAVVLRELRERHGEPLAGSPKAAPSWWTVPSGIFVVGTSEFLSVSYQHGRLHRIAEWALKSGGP